MKMKRLTALICLLVAFLCLCSFEERAAIKLDNQWGTAPLTEEQIVALDQLAAEEGERVGGADFLVVFAENFESTAEAELRANGYHSDRQDVIGLVIWNGGTYYETELYTYGDMDRYISDADLDALKSAVDVDAKAGRFYEAARTMILRSAEMLAAGRAANPPKTPGQKVLTAVIVGVVIGALSGGVAVLLVVLRYRKKNRSASYPLEQFATLHLTMERDVFLYHTVVKTAIPTGNGGKSSGGGGRSSGRS